jgi:hypothetical protein
VTAAKNCGDWPTAADAHRARNAAFAPGIGIGADESRAPPSAPSRRHDDGSSGEEGVIALIPRSSVYVAPFITTTCGVACGVSRDASPASPSRQIEFLYFLRLRELDLEVKEIDF